jgi:hypothetical protein
MRKLTMVVFVVALIIVAFETFQPQPKLTGPTTDVTGTIQSILGH